MKKPPLTLIIKFMRVVMLTSLLFATAMLASASSKGQLLEKEQYSVSFRNETLETCIRKIRQLTGVEFAYNPEELKQFSISEKHFDRQNLGSILSGLFAATPLAFREMDNSIVIYAPLQQVIVMQDQNVRGTVRSPRGEILPGVSIRVKGKRAGAVSDKDGDFIIRCAPGDVLQFSFLGYVSQEVTVGNGPLRVVLHEDNAELREVIVVGYGEQRKRNVVGAIGTIDAKEIQRSPVVNASDALAGRVPGLMAVKSAGGPGRGSALYIRGFSTINSGPPLNSLSPLVVVDGIPGRGLDNLDPNEIETISVLKDASASAVYGARAANGVILVTTKKGMRGAPTISLNSSVVMQRPTRLYDILDSYDYAVLQNEAYKNEDN